MTNKQRLESLLGFAPSKESVEGELIDLGIDGALTYDGTYKNGIRAAAINLIELLLSSPDQTNEMLTIKYDRDAVMKRLAILKNDSGEVLVSRNIRNASNRW